MIVFLKNSLSPLQNFFILPQIQLSELHAQLQPHSPSLTCCCPFRTSQSHSNKLLQLYCTKPIKWEQFVPWTALLHINERNLYSHFLDVLPSTYTKAHLFWGNDHLINRVQLFVYSLIYP